KRSRQRSEPCSERDRPLSAPQWPEAPALSIRHPPTRDGRRLRPARRAPRRGEPRHRRCSSPASPSSSERSTRESTDTTRAPCAIASRDAEVSRDPPLVTRALSDGKLLLEHVVPVIGDAAHGVEEILELLVVETGEAPECADEDLVLVGVD